MEFAENFSCFSTEISDESEKFRDTQFSQEDNIFHIKKNKESLLLQEQLSQLVLSIELFISDLIM